MPVILRYPGIQDYETAWAAMKQFVENADDRTDEEIWLLQHPPVYTLGRAAGQRRHLLRDNGIAVVRSDRGGQVTYHAPGQAVAYLLWNVRRRQLGLRALVCGIENAVTDLLAAYDITAAGNPRAPGVYTDSGAKIAALGLRLRRGWCYHGLSLNVDMDLAPFADINPCGYEGLAVTQMRDYGASVSADAVMPALAQCLLNRF